MKKLQFIALLLAAILTIFCITPTAVYAAEAPEATEAATEPEVTGRAPYTLRTEQADAYDANTVRVWLELDPAKAESVTSYQIALQLKDGEGSATLGREMSLSFDETLEKAQIKEAVFNPETQVMQIYVAASENLVQIVTNQDGSTVNMLPIGTLSVAKLQGEKNAFKIALSGNTGDLMTVDTSMAATNVAETYGADFEIPVDGAVYGEPVRFPLGIEVEGKGTVKAYVVEDGSETLAEGELYEGAVVRLRATPAQGYRLAELILTDSRNAEHEIELGGDFSFTMDSVIGVKARFEEVEETYTVAVGENAAIRGTTANAAKFKARAVATVLAKAPEGQKFVCWKNVQGDVVSYKETYSFVVTSDIILIPEFAEASAEKTELPVVTLNTSGTVTRFGSKYRVSYSGMCTVPSGYKLVKRGVLLTNQAIDESNLEEFVMGGTVNSVKVATCAVSGTSAQFIANINNVAGGQNRTARAFLTYADKDGNEVTVYSTNMVALTTP